MGQSRDDQAVSGGNSLHSPFKPLVLTCHVSLLAKRPALVCFQIRSNQSINTKIISQIGTLNSQLNYAKIEFASIRLDPQETDLGYIDLDLTNDYIDDSDERTWIDP